jgi:hypothetical protein
MNERIKKLREETLNAVNTLSEERALLLTEFYQSADAREVSVPVRRALAFKHIMMNKKLWFSDGELIVGERGPEPKAVPTYPEINLHSLKDLEILDTRAKVWFRADEETKKAYREIIIPFWTGKTNREKIFRNLDQNWLDAYQAGVFTEFQEQRSPGHTACGSMIYKKGFRTLAKVYFPKQATQLKYDVITKLINMNLYSCRMASEPLNGESCHWRDRISNFSHYFCGSKFLVRYSKFQIYVLRDCGIQDL